MTNEFLTETLPQVQHYVASGWPQYLAAYAAGHTVGAVADKFAINRAERNNEALQSENQVDPTVLRAPHTLYAAVNRAAQTDGNVEPSRMDTVRRSLLSPVAGFAGTSAVLLAYGLLPAAAIETAPPKIGVVVDHSFDTTVGEKPAIDRIDELVAEFDDSRVNAKALVASAGEYLPLDIDKVAENEPFGGGGLRDATSFALSDKNSALVVATNGNTIADPAVIIPAAKAAKTPIFIVNVESAKAVDQAAVDGLKQIAKETGGKYWENTAVNADAISDDVKAALIPNEIRRVAKTGQQEALGLAAVAAFFGAVTYRKRSGLTLSSKKLKG